MINSHLKKTLFVSVALLFGTTSAMSADMAALKAEGKGIIMSFAKSLKGELKKGMKAGGPVKAIAVCNTKAPEITKNTSDANEGWTISRTSLKLRNEGNAPDAWEKAVLEKFDAAHAKGKSPKKMAYAEIIEKDGKKTFRMMKAIPTGGVCMACHGTPGGKVKAKLGELYPNDKATGYKPGQVRGAFSLSKNL